MGRSLTIEKEHFLLARQAAVSRKAATDLMELPREETRLALSEVLDRPTVLVSVIENSMGLDGSGGASLLSALEPEEIQKVVWISRQVFADEWIYLDWKKGSFDPISPEAVSGIFSRGDPKEISRLKFLGPATASSTKQGPWGILRDWVAIRPEAVMDYLRSIQSAECSAEWKAEAVKSLGCKLLAYTATQGREYAYDVPDICEEIDPDFGQQIVEYFATINDLELLKAQIIDEHMEQMAAAVAVAIVTSEEVEELQRLEATELEEGVAALMEVEGDFGSLAATDIEDIRGADQEIRKALKKGLK